MSIIVFLGPSLPLAEAGALLDADYRPPARAGDLYAATLGKPQAIALIDGLFEAVPAVWHKEILHALEQGISVYGASSMGALRAAELHAFGMRGVGRIFEQYASGALEDDDEVALVHAPAEGGYRAMSEPMVNIREGLRRALAMGLLTPHTHDLLLGMAKSQFYPDRSWSALGRRALDAGAAQEEVERLLAFVEREKPDLKREDARALLCRMAEDARRGFAPRVPGFRLERSIFFHRLAETTERAAAGADCAGETGVAREDIVHHAMLTLEERTIILRDALLAALVTGASSGQSGAPIGQAQIRERAEIFRRERRLFSTEAMNAWLQANAMSAEAFEQMMRVDAQVARLLAEHGGSLQGQVIAELQRRGRLAEIARAVRSKHEALDRLGIAHPRVQDTGMEVPTLLEWHAHRFPAIHGPLDRRAAELGFETAQQLLEELAGLYLWKRSSDAEHPCG